MPRARARQLNLNNDHVDVVENAQWAKARDDFAVYRKVIRREMLWDWWPQEVSEKLQQFYADLKDGKRPKMAIMAPPQHGKSTAATDFITWVAGQDPNLKTIFASFSDQLGERTNKEVQRIMRTEAYIKIFGRTRLDIPGWSTNTTLIESRRPSRAASQLPDSSGLGLRAAAWQPAPPPRPQGGLENPPMSLPLPEYQLRSRGSPGRFRGL
jgi:hypothetical protein